MSTSDDLREGLATLAHEQWSSWMRYLFGRCTFNNDGTATIPAWAVERWQRQMFTPYDKLSENKRESDRHQADKVIAIIEQYTNRKIAAIEQRRRKKM